MLIFLYFLFVTSIELIYKILSWGFVISKMYIWFIMPLYIEAPYFTTIQFVGIVFFIDSIFFKVSGSEKKKEFTGSFNLDITPWIAFLCAWLFKTFLY